MQVLKKTMLSTIYYASSKNFYHMVLDAMLSYKQAVVQRTCLKSYLTTIDYCQYLIEGNLNYEVTTVLLFSMPQYIITVKISCYWFLLNC